MRAQLSVLLLILAQLAGAQVSDTSRSAAGAKVSGMVRDSIARGPLAGATVQLIAAEDQASFARTAVTDSSGIFVIHGVPDGRYLLGFFHPMLDSLGVEAPATEVRVVGGKPVRADLAIPSAARLRSAICGKRSGPDSAAVVVGVVRDARDGMPLSGVAVTGEWLELTFMKGGMVRRVPRLVATTGENGWFAMCNVPSAGTMTLMAGRGADSTDLIELQVPAEGFLRRELFIAPSKVVVIPGDTAKRPDSLTLAPRRIRVGDGRVSGTVIAAIGGKPLGGALVRIADGPETRANDRGEWTITDAPAGTRMLEVRAVGFYPDRRKVDVIAGAPPVRVALSTLQAVLDTVRIVASRVRGRDISGFYDRKRSAMGRYLTPEDISRRASLLTSDIFRMVPGLSLERDSLGQSVLLMRGAWGLCAPDIWVDGMYMNLTAEDIDNWLRPKEIAGIEVYPSGTAPPQFQRGMSGCGSIVFWRK
jgi:hypothetical protein